MTAKSVTYKFKYKVCISDGVTTRVMYISSHLSDARRWLASTLYKKGGKLRLDQKVKVRMGTTHLTVWVARMKERPIITVRPTKPSQKWGPVC